jgi:hypothetical protein
MYLFPDPDDHQQRFIDYWNPTLGVLSYEGYLNETFNDEDINSTIKFKLNQTQPGVYAKRDIYLHEELFTEYGKPQWIYTLFFPNHLSSQTLQAIRQRYQLLPTITADMDHIIRPSDLPIPHPSTPLNPAPDPPDHQNMTETTPYPPSHSPPPHPQGN